MSQHYSDPEREHDPHALPDIEVFQLTAREAAERDDDLVWEWSRKHEYRLAAMCSKVREEMFDAMIKAEGITGGWFWWSCFPGCMPEGYPIGPFATEAEAVADMRHVDY
jgi:hypothetical protein